jgi:methyl-accepting chemotaxis protein
MSSFALRLTHKITAIAVIGVIGVFLIGGIHLYGESATAVYRDAAVNARALSELNNRIEIELLEGRRAEKDFLLRNDPKRAENQTEIARSVAAAHGLVAVPARNIVKRGNGAAALER